MNNNDDQLQIKIVSNFNKAISQIKEMTNSVAKMGGEVSNAKIKIDKAGNLKSTTTSVKGLSNSIKLLGNSIKTTFTKDADGNIKSVTYSLQKLGNSKKWLKGLKSWVTYFGGLKAASFTIRGWIKASIDYIETANKFEVSMGSMSESAYKFQNALAEAFGTSKKEMMDFQSNFYNILSTIPGIADEAAYRLSETLTNMGLDFSSLFNVSESAAMEKIQAALIGNVKSIRSTSGYDTTDATIAQYAQSLGIEKSVRNLSQMEKRLLRVIVLMQQMKASGAMADMARTIEQPANQIKVFKNQLQELQIALGNLFVGTLGNIMPYINGFIMALTEIIKRLAILVGFQESVSSSPMEVAAEFADSLDNSLGGAVSSAKELKKTLMGFDVLNVIQTQKDSGAGSSGLDVDPRILNALGDYDSMMEDVQMKATKIRDNILEWFDTPIGKAAGIGGAALIIGGLVGKVAKIGGAIKGLFAGAGAAAAGSAGTAAVGAAAGSAGTAAVGAAAGETATIGFFAAVKSGAKLLAGSIGELVSSGFASIFGTGLAGVGTFAASVVAPLAAAAWGAHELSKEIGDLTHTSDLLDDSISQTTKDALGPFLEKFKEMGVQLKTIEFTGKIISDDTLAELNTSVDTIYSTIIAGLDKNYTTLSEVISNADYFPDEGKREEYLKNLTESYNTEKEQVTTYQNQIKQIYQTANKENRTLTATELDQVQGLRKKMGELGIKTLSANEKEALKIKAKFIDKQQDLNIEQISEAIKAAKKLKDDTIKTAKDEYDKKIALALEYKETLPGFTQEMYDEMTKTAKDEYDQQVKDAGKAYQDIVDAAEENYPEVTKAINKETGEIKSGWETAVETTKTAWNNVSTAISTVWDSAKKGWQILKSKMQEPIDFSANYPKWDSIKKEYEGKNVSFNGTMNISPVVKTNPQYDELRQLHRITAADALGISIKGHADGGFPTMGELFLAREAGPELVGRIGNQSAVVNTQQIVAAVSQGVAQAVASVMPKGGGNYNLIVDGYQLNTVIAERQARTANIAG